MECGMQRMIQYIEYLIFERQKQITLFVISAAAVAAVFFYSLLFFLLLHSPYLNELIIFELITFQFNSF